MNLGKILLSASMIAFVGAAAFTGTGAFFSDTETSTGNTFTAGEIDLTVDSVAHYNGLVCFNNEWVPEGAVVWNPQTEQLEDDGDGDSLQDEINTFNIDNPENFPEAGTECGGTWSLTDLGPTHQFFNYGDLKPGDNGENTLSLHLDTNDGYVCAVISNLQDDDNGLTEPEEEDGDNTGGDGEGELSSELRFFAWADDGDNIWEDEEQVLFSNTEGPASDVIDGVSYDLFTPANGQVMPAGETAYIGLYWCYGDITVDEGENTLSCDGASVTNVTQTDSMTADISFYVEQARNNENFTCPDPDEFGGGEERELVGAALGGYDAPISCNATVAGTESIQSAIAGAEVNDTICVDGTYDASGDTYPLTVDVEGLTIAGLGNAGDANIPGGIFVDASDVTITGLEFTGYDFIASSENAAVYIHNEEGQGSGTSLTGTTISYNIFTAPGSAKGDLAKGVVTEISAGSAIASGISVMHNVFTDWRQGIFYNTANHETAYNDFMSNDVGVANDGPDASSIHHNDFEGNVLEAVGVAPSATNGTSNDGILTVNTNNFSPAGSGNNVNWYGVSVVGGADVDATGNWWDSEAEADRTNDTAEVDTSSPEAVAFPEN